MLLADAVGPAPSTKTEMSAYRRGDVVRDLAREFEDLSVQDLRERLPAMTTQIFTNGELSVLFAEVRDQVLSDLVDLLDQRHQGRLRARRTVRVVAPRGYVVRTTSRLSTQERGWVGGRLRQRGWSSDDVRRVLPSKT